MDTLEILKREYDRARVFSEYGAGGLSLEDLNRTIQTIEQLRQDKAELEKSLNIRVVDAINVNQWIGKLEKELNLEPCIDSEGSQFYHLPRILEAVETLAKHKGDE